MPPIPLIEYFHVLLGIVFVATLFASQWNMVAARRTENWPERARLFAANRRLALVFALPSLLATGVLGTLLANRLGFLMATTRSLQLVTGLWIVLLVILLAFDLPLSSQLAAMARTASNASNGGRPVGWQGSITRWRVANATQMMVFLVLLWFMVAAWRQ